MSLVDITKSIEESIDHPQFIIKDPFISRGKPVLTKRGRPVQYTGGFAVVYPFIVDGQKWAFRCWYTSLNVNDVMHRLTKISELFKKIKLPYFCDFTYESKGLVVDGQVYPTTRMRWIEGLNLKD